MLPFGWYESAQISGRWQGSLDDTEITWRIMLGLIQEDGGGEGASIQHVFLNWDPHPALHGIIRAHCLAGSIHMFETYGHT